MEFEICFKVYNLVPFHPNIMKRDLSCGGVSLPIGLNLKLPPIPCAISEWPKCI